MRVIDHCIMGNCHIGPPPLNRQTNTYENITFPQIRWRTVINSRQKRVLSFIVYGNVNEPFVFHSATVSTDDIFYYLPDDPTYHTITVAQITGGDSNKAFD